MNKQNKKITDKQILKIVYALTQFRRNNIQRWTVVKIGVAIVESLYERL